MKGFSRRELLQGLAAGSALALMGPLARIAAGERTQSMAAPFQRVNVLFHGRFVIDFGEDEVSVYPASASPEYAFLAGTWMQEISLVPGREYRLSGVVTGPRPELRSIDPKRTPIFRRQPVDDADSFCKLVFPFPDFVTPLRLVGKEHRKHFFAGTPAPVILPSEVPQLLAFSYTRPDLTSTLQCRPLKWTPVIMAGVVNLHLWAAPAREPDPQHSLLAFARMAKLMNSPDLRLDPVYAKIKPPRPDDDPLVPGVSCQDELTLIERFSDPPACGRKNSYHPKDAPLSDSLSLILY
jgi:hypothetical protein